MCVVHSEKEKLTHVADVAGVDVRVVIAGDGDERHGVGEVPFGDGSIDHVLHLDAGLLELVDQAREEQGVATDIVCLEVVRRLEVMDAEVLDDGVGTLEELMEHLALCSVLREEGEPLLLR